MVILTSEVRYCKNCGKKLKSKQKSFCSVICSLTNARKSISPEQRIEIAKRSYQNGFAKFTSERRTEISRKAYQSGLAKLTHEQHVEIGKHVGRISVESGNIFEMQKKSLHHNHIIHLSHEHFSNSEYRECLKHHEFFPQNWIHPLIRFSGKEIDWIIADPKVFKKKDPSTWLFCIEFHPPLRIRKETFNQYRDERISILRRLGITCPILIYYTKNQWQKIVSIYRLNEIMSEKSVKDDNY